MVLRPVPSLAALIAVSVIGGGCPWWPFWPGVAPDGGPDGVPCGETVEDPGGLGSWTTCPHFGPVRALKGPATGGDVQMLAPISTTETFFVTSGRLGRYAQGRIERFDFRDHGAVTALAPGLVPGMAFGTDRGFVGWWTGEALVGVSLPNEERVRSVTVSELGRVWALQSSQVTEVDPASLEHRSWPSPDERVSSIVVEPEGSPWVSTSHELFRLGDGAEWARVIPESEGYDDLRLVRSAADTAWFQTSGPGPTNRLFQVGPEGTHLVTELATTSLIGGVPPAFDGVGWWFVADANWLSRFEQGKWTLIPLPGATLPVACSPLGACWAAGSGSGLFARDGGEWQAVVEDGPTLLDAVTDGTSWLLSQRNRDGASHLTRLVSDERDSELWPPGPSYASSIGCFEGDVILQAQWGGLFRAREERWELIPSPVPVTHHSQLRSRDGRLMLVGGQGRLAVWDGGVFQLSQGPPGVSLVDAAMAFDGALYAVGVAGNGSIGLLTGAVGEPLSQVVLPDVMPLGSMEYAFGQPTVRLAASESGGVWIVTQERVARWHEDQLRDRSEHHISTPLDVGELDGALVVATTTGVEALDGSGTWSTWAPLPAGASGRSALLREDGSVVYIARAAGEEAIVEARASAVVMTANPLGVALLADCDGELHGTTSLGAVGYRFTTDGWQLERRGGQEPASTAILLSGRGRAWIAFGGGRDVHCLAGDSSCPTVPELPSPVLSATSVNGRPFVTHASESGRYASWLAETGSEWIDVPQVPVEAVVPMATPDGALFMFRYSGRPRLYELVEGVWEEVYSITGPDRGRAAAVSRDEVWVVYGTGWAVLHRSGDGTFVQSSQELPYGSWDRVFALSDGRIVLISEGNAVFEARVSDAARRAWSDAVWVPKALVVTQEGDSIVFTNASGVAHVWSP